MQKNVAGQKWVVFAFDRTDNTPKTGDAAQITANLRIDGGGANAVDDTNPTELEDGFYFFNITQAESNGDYILISPVSSTSDIQVIGCPAAVFTTAPNFNTLGIESDGDLTKVNALDGHTAQTGDSYAIVSGDHGLVSIQDDVDAILEDTGTTLPATLTTIEGKVDDVDTVVDGIQTDLDNGVDGLGALKTLIDAVPTASEIQTEMEENGASILDTLQDRLTAARAGYLDELNAATVGKLAWYMAKLFIDVINKKIITEANGNTEQFNDSNVSIGTIAGAYDTDGTFTTRLRMVQ